jgi:hypothetical protein
VIPAKQWSVPVFGPGNCSRAACPIKPPAYLVMLAAPLATPKPCRSARGAWATSYTCLPPKSELATSDEGTPCHPPIGARGEYCKQGEGRLDFKNTSYKSRKDVSLDAIGWTLPTAHRRQPVLGQTHWANYAQYCEIGFSSLPDADTSE